jgi:hypothetical protein
LSTARPISLGAAEAQEPGPLARRGYFPKGLLGVAWWFAYGFSFAASVAPLPADNSGGRPGAGVVLVDVIHRAVPRR